jgi:phage tail-like protein
MAEFVRGFKFQVTLTRSRSLGPTASTPPELTISQPLRQSKALPPSPQRIGADGSTPAGNGLDQTDPNLRGLNERIGDGGFQECTGLDIEADIHEYLEGGRNDQIIRRVGRIKLQPIVLKRGMLVKTSEDPARSTGGYANTELWDWLRNVVAGQAAVLRYDGAIDALDPADAARVTAHWSFVRGLPIKVVGPQLNAKTGEIVVEELHIAHEGLRLEHQA